MKDATADHVHLSPPEYEQHQVAVPPPLPPHRRPRVREVSSRFMSSVTISSSSNSPGDVHHHHPPKSPLPKLSSITPTHRSRSQELEPLSTHADENVLAYRSLDTPLSHINRQRKQKHFKENNGGGTGNDNGRPLEDHQHQQPRSQRGTPSAWRPDTPAATLVSANSSRSSRLRRPNNVTAAAKLFQSIGMSEVGDNNAQAHAPANIPTLTASDSYITATSPLSITNSKTSRCNPDLRSSLPEVDSRLLADKSCTIGSNSSKCSASPCSRSLNLPLSSCSNVKLGGSISLPPLPSSKLGADSRRARKDLGHQEQMHYLKLLYNHYLQWRYANAKAEVSAHAQTRETERELYSLQVRISDLRDAVKRKRIELGLLRRTNTLSAILEAHMPYLDQWSTLEGEYSSSLSEVISALLNASVQLPICANVQADTREVWEALNSAIKMTESIGVHIQRFGPKAEEVDALITELARVAGGERALMEECGHRLFKTYSSQVEECSLRGSLIQLHRSAPHQPQED